MDIQLTVTILLIYTKCLNNTLSPSGEILIRCLPAGGTFPANPAGPLYPHPGQTPLGQLGQEILG